MRLTAIAGLAAVALLLGCSGPDSDAGTPERPFTEAGVTFSLTPSAARGCEPDLLYEAVLRWSVDGVGEPRLEIRVDAVDGPLFARSNEAAGEARTGEWVRRGMWFLLVDRRGGRVLAAQRAGPEHCD